MTTKLSDADEEKIIDFVKMHEILYNVKHKHFRNPEARNRLWGKLASEMDMPVDTLKRKWATMRDYYIRKSTGARANTSKRDKLMSFLDHKSILNQAVSNEMPRPTNHLLHSYFHETGNNSMVCNISPCNEKKMSTHLQRHLKQYHPSAYEDYVHKKNRVVESDIFSDIEMDKEEDTSEFKTENFNHPQITIKDFEETIATPMSNTQEFADVFAPQCTQRVKQDLIQKASELWTIKIQNMDPTQALLAEKLINDIVYNGQMGLLNQNSSVQIGFRVNHSMNCQNVLCADMSSTFAKDEPID